MKRKSVLWLLKTAARLPWWMFYGLSDIVSFLLYHLVRYRRSLTRRNLTESFPDKSIKEIKRIERAYYRNMSDIMVETIKMLHISDKEMARRAKVIDTHIVNRSLECGRSAVVFLGHYGNWEWVQEISRTLSDRAVHGSIYHRMDSPLWDDIFLTLRSRWGAVLVPQQKAVRTLLDKSNQPWVFGFIADHRPNWGDLHNWTMFLNHDTPFVNGPEAIGSKVDADFFYLDVRRIKRGHYTMTFRRLEPLTDGLPYPYTRAFWQEFEKTIREDPPYWLWSHNRWAFTRDESHNRR